MVNDCKQGHWSYICFLVSVLLLSKSARFRLAMSLSVSVCLCMYLYRAYLIENQKSKTVNFVDFYICHRMASLRKLYSVTMTYSLTVKESNRDLPTVTSEHSGATGASKDLNRTFQKWWTAERLSLSKVQIINKLFRRLSTLAFAIEFIVLLLFFSLPPAQACRLKILN